MWEAEHWPELLADNQIAIRTHLLSTRERAVAKTIKNIQVTRLQMIQVAVSWMPPPFAARTSYFKISEEAETSAGNLAEKDGNDVLHRRVSVYLSIYLSIYDYLYINPSIYLSIYPSIHHYPSLSIIIHHYPSIHPSISLSLSLSVCLSVFLPTCLHASLSLSLMFKYIKNSQQYCKYCWKSIEMCHSCGLIDMVLLEIGASVFPTENEEPFDCQCGGWQLATVSKKERDIEGSRLTKGLDKGYSRQISRCQTIIFDHEISWAWEGFVLELLTKWLDMSVW